jgi:hypothetical protein
MAHVRKQIRDRIAALLDSGVALVEGRVYNSRVYALTQSKLPAITVYIGSEDSSLFTLGSKTLMRTVSVSVDIYENATASLDDNLDALAVQVEESIAADFQLNGLAKDAVLVSTEIDFSGESEQPVGVARLTFNVRYVTSVEDVETAR